MGDISYRIALTILNIFFPPLAVAILCGFGADFMVNCLWFLLAVIPSHIHGFWISRTYFHRRRKVRKGRYPGGLKPMMYSHKILNGGASDAEVERLRRLEMGGRKRRSRSGSNARKPKSSVRARSADRRLD